MSKLFTPITLREITIAHRAWMSPMMQFAAVPDGPDVGTATDWHLQHLGARAVAGAALIMVEATAVTPDGRSSDYDLGLWNDRQAQVLRRHTDFLRAQVSSSYMPAGRRRPGGRGPIPTARTGPGPRWVRARCRSGGYPHPPR
jgi:2,4-dienoyl-CoA reductase-like NADH-dependent reductase (Old Yellow Enzyme family)